MSRSTQKSKRFVYYKGFAVKVSERAELLRIGTVNLKSFYLFVFSIAIFLIECNCIRARVWFYFMNYSLGKSIFYLFMTLLCFGSGATVSVFDIIVGAIFALMCMMFLTFHFIFKADEPAHV